jgi:superfamily II DNA/RNA helicase
MIICTPGKMIAHLNMGYVKINELQYLVLDEADRMLDIGFYDDIMKIISYLPKNRQSLMFSATFPPKIRELAKKILRDPAEINIGISKPAEKILQLAYVVYETQKIPLLKYLLSDNLLKSVLVFCSTKKSAKELTRELKKQGLAVQDIHSDLDQNERKEALTQFKNKKLNILVATDILSRGIDIEDIDQVINFDVPNDGEDYIHRIGRTARAEADGIAITFISPKEQFSFNAIEQLLGEPVHKAVVPHQFGESPEYKPQKHPPFRRKNFRASKKR